MLTKKRLIDANELVETLNHTTMVAYPNLFPGLLAAAEIVEDAPTVDAVEVVRCKDCMIAQKEEPLGTLWCNGTIVKGDYFCASGERRPYRGNG